MIVDSLEMNLFHLSDLLSEHGIQLLVADIRGIKVSGAGHVHIRSRELHARGAIFDLVSDSLFGGQVWLPEDRDGDDAYLIENVVAILVRLVEHEFQVLCGHIQEDGFHLSRLVVCGMIRIEGEVSYLLEIQGVIEESLIRVLV